MYLWGRQLPHTYHPQALDAGSHGSWQLSAGRWQKCNAAQLIECGWRACVCALWIMERRCVGGAGVERSVLLSDADTLWLVISWTRRPAAINATDTWLDAVTVVKRPVATCCRRCYCGCCSHHPSSSSGIVADHPPCVPVIQLHGVITCHRTTVWAGQVVFETTLYVRTCMYECLSARLTWNSSTNESTFSAAGYILIHGWAHNILEEIG